MYAQDYDEVLPMRGYRGTPGWGWVYTWRVATFPYVKNEQIFHCPELAVSAYGSHPAFDGMDPSDKGHCSGYAVNGFHAKPGGPEPPAGHIWAKWGIRCWTFAALERPADTVYLLDGYGAADISYQSNEHSSVEKIMGSDAHRAALTRHNGGANYGFLDGHVKWMTPTQITCETGACQFAANYEG